jgi:endonuclease/exonuclease/phosphatase family metal-dependent hydrolase
MKKDREECMIVGGDFNEQIGERGTRNRKEEKGDGKRKTKDKVEKRLMEWIEENRWEVLNGNKQGYEEGELTYVGSREKTVTDYAIVNEAAWERVEKFKVGERVDSDHLPLEITIQGTNYEEKGKGEAMEKQKKATIKVWDEQGQRYGQTREKGENQRIEVQQGV